MISGMFDKTENIKTETQNQYFTHPVLLTVATLID